MKKYLSTTLLGASFVASAALAAPSAPATNDIFADGQTLTLTGSAFGDGATPILWSNMESGAQGAPLNDAPDVGVWNVRGDRTRYSTGDAHSGSKSAYSIRNAGSTGGYNMSTASSTAIQQADFLYLSFWFKYDDNGSTGEQTKVFQLHGTESTCDYVPGIMSGGFADGWWASYNVADPSDCSNGKIQESYYTGAPSESTWHHAELIARRSDYGVENGTIVINIDSQAVYSRVGNIMTRAGGSANWSKFLFLYSLTNATADWETWLDDTYAATTWARVEIGNAATYEDATHREIQVPSTWENESITITANAGSFEQGESVYLYVIDAEGNASPGTPITIGGAAVCDVDHLTSCTQTQCEALAPTHYWRDGSCSTTATGPSVSEVVGAVVDGQELTISGSGFGSSPNVVLFDDFESGEEGTNIKTGPGSAKFGRWNRFDVAGSHFYGNTAKVSGALSFTSDYSVSSVNWIEALLPDNTRNVFISWWLYLPETSHYPGETNANGINWKQMWLQGSSTTDDDLVLPTRHSSWQINGNDGDPGYYNYTNVSFTKGEWKRLWVWLKGSSSSSSDDGEVKLWELNSTGVSQLEDDVGVNNLKASGNWERVRPNGWGRKQTNCVSSFDDIYIAAGPSAQARVEMGNAASYSDSSELTILTPTNWGDTQISATVNQGVFAQGDAVYLFVIDASGAVSPGIGPFVVGGGTDETAPQLSALEPSGEVSCVVSSAVDVSLTATTNEAASCRYGSAGSTWSAMDPMEQTGGTGHRHTLSLDCEQSYNYAIICRDAADNESDAGSIAFTTVAGALVTDIVLDNTDHNSSSTGSWTASTHYPNFYGVDYLYSSNNTSDSFTWTTSQLQPGSYDVFAWWTADVSRPVDVHFVIEHAAGTSTVSAVDQTTQGAQWVLLGNYDFGNTGTVTLSDSGTGTGGACADAVRFVASTGGDAGMAGDTGPMLDAGSSLDATTLDTGGGSDASPDAAPTDTTTGLDVLTPSDALASNDTAVNDDATAVSDATGSNDTLLDAGANDASRDDVIAPAQDAASLADAGTDTDPGCECQMTNQAILAQWPAWLALLFWSYRRWLRWG